LSKAAPAVDIGDDEPVTLAEASKVILRGIVTVSALRAEIRRGNLAVERIGKNLFTTPAAIREMRSKCRVMPNRQDYTSEKTEAKASGSSATAERTSELAALKASVQALKNGSLSTLRKSTPTSQPKAASPIPFPSRKSSAST
jgi:hypothetical protein